MKGDTTMIIYHVGFKFEDEFNGIASAPKLSIAKELAKEIEKEYGEVPVIIKEIQQ